MKTIRPLSFVLTTLALFAGCGQSGPPSYGERMLAATTTCSRVSPSTLAKLKTDGSCVSDADCLPLGPTTHCVIDPITGSGKLCQKSCDSDADCSFGAYCDPSTFFCNYDCDGVSTSGALACGSGKQCDCNGRCQIGAGPPPQSVPHPQLDTLVRFARTESAPAGA